MQAFQSVALRRACAVRSGARLRVPSTAISMFCKSTGNAFYKNNRACVYNDRWRFAFARVSSSISSIRWGWRSAKCKRRYGASIVIKATFISFERTRLMLCVYSKSDLGICSAVIIPDEMNTCEQYLYMRFGQLVRSLTAWRIELWDCS